MRQYRLQPAVDGVHVIVGRPWAEQVEKIVPAASYLERLGRTCGMAFEKTELSWGFGGCLLRVSGKETIRYVARFHQSPRATSTSLNLLCSTLLGSFDVPVPELPLIGIRGLHQRSGNSGWDMGMDLSPDMQQLLDQFTEEDVVRVSACLRSTGSALGLREGVYGVQAHAGRLFLAIPGEATWLGCPDTLPSRETPLWLSGHNIDTAAQQFTLLRGLAEVQYIAEEHERSHPRGS